MILYRLGFKQNPRESIHFTHIHLAVWIKNSCVNSHLCIEQMVSHPNVRIRDAVMNECLHRLGAHRFPLNTVTI